jgi:3-oxoacyl-[acyl-carrier-protein] synthase-3
MASLIIKAGGSRFPGNQETNVYKKCSDGIVRTDEQICMNSSDILTFTLQEIPLLFNKVLQDTGWKLGDIDACIMHQANELILNSLHRKIGIPKEKMIVSLKNFGNTSSASIPLSITDQLKELKNVNMNLIAIGYGVGLSWGAAAITCGPLCLPDLIEV